MANSTSPQCFSVQTCRSAPANIEYRRHLLELERSYDFCQHFEWGTRNWKIVYVIIAFYLGAIFAGQRYMRHRAAWKLRTAMLTWNGALAAFSIFAACRTVSAVGYLLSLDSFHATVCEGISQEYGQSVGIYMSLFYISKVVELGDTVFIVLRKTPLIVLHWFHHATVCYFVWSCSAYPSTMHVYFMVMNYSVHAFMYSYYILKVLHVAVPRPINVAITSLQLLQMLGGVGVTLYARRMKRTPGVGCCVTEEAVTIALVIYFSYFVLFLNFFLRAYVLDKRSSKALARKNE